MRLIRTGVHGFPQGLIDFVTIMDYSTDVKQFEKWITAVKEKTGSLAKVKIAVGAYKMVNTPDIFEQEYRRCEEMSTTCGGPFITAAS